MSATAPTTTDVWFNGPNRAKVLVDSASTGGTLAVVEMHIPAGNRAPLHRHVDEHEAFVVLDGTLRVLVDGVGSELGPGDAGTMPAGAVHSYIAMTDCRVHVVVGGRASFDGFVRELGTPATEPMPSELPPMPVLLAAAAAHGIEVLGPPPETIEVG